MEEIRTLQRQTTDAVSRLFAKGPTSFSGVKDIRPSLMRLRIGSSLGISELLSISRLLEASSRVKSYGRREQSETNPDSLDGLFAGLEPVAEDGILTVKMNPEQDFILLAAFYDEEGRFCLAGGCEAKPGMEPATFGIPADSSGYRLFALDLGYRPECQAFYAEL